MNLKLVLLSQAKCDATEFKLSESSYSIGRKQDNELRIEEFCVSGYHAEVYRTSDGDYEVTDLDSSEGTFLNRKRISAPAKIKAGDVLKLGVIKLAVKEHQEKMPPTSNNAPGDGIIRFDAEPLVEGLEDGDTELEELEHDLHETLDHVSAQRDKAEQEVQRLSEEVSRLREESSMRDASDDSELALELSELKYSLDAEKLLTDAVKGKNEEFRSKIELLTTDLGNAQEELNRLKATKVQQLPLPEDFEDKGAKFAKLQEELAHSHNDNADLQAELTDHQIEIASLKGELTNREIELIEKEKSETKVDTSQEKQLRREVKELKAKLVESEKAAREKKDDLSQKNLQDQLKAAEEAARKVEKQEAHLQKAKAELTAKLKEAEEKSVELEARIEESTSSDSKNATLIRKLKKELKESQLATEGKLHDELESIREKQAAAEAEVAELQEKLAAAEGEARQFREELDVSQDQCSDIDVLLSAKTNLASEQGAMIEQLNKELTEMKQSYEASEKKLTAAHEIESKALESKLEKARKESDQLKKDLKGLRSELASLEKSSAKEKTELTREQEAKLSKLEEDFAESMEQRSEIESAQDDLRDQLEERDDRIAALTGESENLESRIKEAEEEKSEIATVLQLTKEGLSEALHRTRMRAHEANHELEAEILRRVKVENLLEKSEEARKGLRHEIEVLEAESDEGVVLSVEEPDLPQGRELTEKQTEELRAFEERMASLHPVQDSDSGEKKAFGEVDFYRKWVENLDLVDELIKSYENKWRFNKIVKQLIVLKDSLIELLEGQSVNQFILEPGTPLCMNQSNRLELVPFEDGTLPKIDPFGNTAVSETVVPGYIFHDGSRDLVIRKATVAVS